MSFSRALIISVACLLFPVFFLYAQNSPGVTHIDSLRTANAKNTNSFLPIMQYGNKSFVDANVNLERIVKQENSLLLKRENNEECNVNRPRVILDKPATNQYPGMITKTKEGNMLIPGWYDTHYDNVNAPSTGCLIKCSMQGDIIWAKHIFSNFPKYCFYYKVMEAADNSIYMTGLQSVYDENHHATYNNLIVLKLDKNGNLLWSKTFTCTAYKDWDNTNMLDVYQIAEDKIGNVYITGTLRNSAPANAFILKLDAQGNLLWNKIFAMSQLTYGYGINFFDNHVILWGSTDYDNYFGVVTVAMTLQEEDGKLIDKRFFSPTSGTPEYSLWANHVYVTELENGNIALAGRLFNDDFLNGSGTTLYSGMVEFTKDLSYVKGYKLSGTYLTNGHETKMTVHPDETIDYTFLNYDNRVTGLNVVFGNIKGGKIKKERLVNYPDFGDSPSYNSLLLPGGGSIQVLQPIQQNKYGKFELISLYDTDVPDECTGIDTNFATVLPFNFKVINPITISEQSGIIKEAGLNSFYIENDELDTYYGCSIKNACDSFTIKSTTEVTCAGQPLNVLFYKNKACNSSIQWSYNGNAADNILALNDSTVQFDFEKEGKGYIKATIPGCTPLSDSLFVVINKSADRIDIGKDTALCKDAAYTINAHTGYQSYVWQDGSTDSVFTAIQTGTYYVQVTDFCNAVYNDSITIDTNPVVTLSLQDQYVKCNADTINIALPEDINSVLFTPSNNIVYSNHQIQVAPASSTSYSIQATTADGCKVEDRLEVKVNTSTPVYLGKDTAICEGMQLELTAPAGFEKYLWSDGNTNDKNIITTGGTYFLKATDNNQCTSADTIAVLLNKNPDISLGPDQMVCADESLLLTPGHDFINYLWQDGATTATYIASKTGKYTVSVTDKNNCRSEASIQILGYYDAPSKGFLDKIDSICNFTDKKLYAKGAWTSYLWSTGATSPAITVNAAGMYWLSVTNNEGCSARDTIQLYPKNCITGIYFPSAFTPNRDGINDIFKPLVYAVLDKFHFVVYNRFGQRVFETKDDRKGWDGTVQGIPQNPATYIWQCTYKLKDQNEKSEKGTVVLLH